MESILFLSPHSPVDWRIGVGDGRPEEPLGLVS